MNLTRMGDLVQSTPLISGLRRKYPGGIITLMVSSDFEDFASRIPDIDEILIFNLRQFNQKNDRGELGSWVEVYEYLKAFLDSVQHRCFDEVYNLSHSKLSALMLSYLDISKVCGFFCNDTGDRMTFHPWLQYFGIEPFNRSCNPFNLVDIYLHAGEIENPKNRVALKTEAFKRESIEIILDELKIKENEVLIGFQAGSSLKGRRWSAESFARLGDMLCSRMDAKILLFGVESEAELAEEIVEKMTMSSHVINVAGKTSIPQLIQILDHCHYLVTNDTGTMHLAAAVETPIVGLFFAHAHPIETGPYAAGNVIFQARISCAPCSYGVTCNDVICINKVRPDDVFQVMYFHHTHGEWKVPEQIKNLEEMNVFVTGFGPDGLLDMKSLIRRSPEKDDLFRLAYRRLWLDSLDEGNIGVNAIDEKLLELTKDAGDNYKLFNSFQLSKDMRLELESLNGLKKLSEQGLLLTDDIGKEVCTGYPRMKKLSSLAEKIAVLDEKINKTGLTYPKVKPISDLFIKRKENLSGDDLKILTNETRQCYKRLFWESSRLQFLLNYFLENLTPQFQHPSQRDLVQLNC